MEKFELERSPLDALRASMDLAAKVDITLSQCNTDQFDELRDGLTNLVSRAYDLNPQVGRKVQITGHAVPIAMNDDLTFSLGLPPAINSDHEVETVSGVLESLEARKFLDNDGMVSYRMVYGVATGDPEHYEDNLGNKLIKTPTTYVCATGAVFETEKHVDAHSLKDLQVLDAVIDEISSVASDKKMRLSERIQYLGVIANSFFGSGEHQDLQMQVVSYINSRGLLNNRYLIASDYIMNNGTDNLLSDQDTPELLKPLYFRQGKKYIRRHPVTLIGEAILYAETQNAQGQVVYVPAESVLDVA